MSHAIDPIAAPVGGQSHDQRQPQRHGADYGGALSHREAVQEKLRVNPAAVAERMGSTPPARAESERQAARQARFAKEDEAAAGRASQRVDIEV